MKNHLLLPMPVQTGGYFGGSLTLICEHSSDGAMGLVLNQPSKTPLQELMTQLGVAPQQPLSPEQRLLNGGPVARSQAFVLHSAERSYPQSMPLMAQASLTTDREVLKDIAEGSAPAHYLVVRGYAGWDAGQLEQELAADAWLALALNPPLSMNALFQVAPEQRLNYAANCAGINLGLLGGRIGYG